MKYSGLKANKKIYRFVKIKIKGDIHALCGLLFEHLNEDFL